MMLESGRAIKLQPPSLTFQPASLHVVKRNISPEKRTDFISEHLNRPFYPTDSTLCHLAKITNLESREVLPNGWKFFMTGEKKKNGYFGAAFWHQDNQHLVISHRGTKNWDGLLTDVKGVILKKYASQVHSACTFAFLVLRELRNGCYFSISITGHSLGGWLAQITTFAIEYLTVADDGLYLRYLNKGERTYHPHTVTFDNPGCYDMLIKLTKDYFPRYENDLISPLDMTSYFIAPNRVNCKNLHAGLLLRFCFKIEDSEGKGVLHKLDPHTVKYHKLNNFLDAFNSCDKPSMYRMFDWPVFSARKTIKDMPAQCLNKITDFLHRPTSSRSKTETSSQIEKLKLSDALIDQFRQPVKDEYSVVKKLGNEKNNFHIDVDHLNKEHTAVHYKSETYNKQSRKTNIFRDDEFIFLENWKAIQYHGINPLEMKTFFHEKKLGEFSDFLQDFEILENNIKSENIELIVKRTKWLFLIFPEMVQVMKKQISENPKLYEAAYRITMNSYIRSLPKYGFSYKDNIGLEDFLENDSNHQMMVLNAKETPDEASRVYCLLQKPKFKNKYCLFSVDDVEYLSKYVDVFGVFASSSTIDEIFVIDFKDSKDIAIPYKLHGKISEKNKKKIICIVPEESGLSETLKFLNIKIVTGNVGFKDLLDFEQRRFLQREVILINSKKYTLSNFVKQEDLATLPFVLIKEITPNQIIEFNLESDHFNQVFLGLSCLKLSKKIINFKALEDFVKNYESTLGKKFSDKTWRINFKAKKDFVKNYESTSGKKFSDVKFFVTGVEDKTLFHFIPEDQIILDLTMNEDRFYEECLSNMEKTIFKLHVKNRDEIQWLEVFDAGLYIRREFHTEIELDNKLLDFLQKEKKINSDYIFVLENHLNLNLKLARLRKDGKIKTVETLTEGNIAFTSKSEGQTGYLIRLNAENQFVLENYQGSIQEIREFARIHENKSISEDELLEKNEKIMLIINEPGMGKSTTLLKIAKKNIEKGWVFWINLINAHELVNCSSSINLDDAITFLLNFSRNSSKLVKTLLQFCLKNEGSVPVYIFFDGFDEIQDWGNKTKSMIQEKILEMIQFLMKTSAKIWVTSRTYDCQKLENELNIFSVNLKEVSKEEQLDFLKKFWLLGTSLDCDNNQNKDELGNYAAKIIRKLNNVINEETRSFMGIPLQLRMIGEVFQPKSWPTGLPDDLNLNLHGLYERFIQRKYEIYSDEKYLNFIPRDLAEVLSDLFNEYHGIVGIKFLFKNFFEDLPQIAKEKFSVINRIGLVQINGESVQFVHRTFAEYFSARKLISLLEKNPGAKFQEFVINILSARDFKVIRRFMNDYLLSISFSPTNFAFVPKNWEKSCAHWEDENAWKNEEVYPVKDLQLYHDYYKYHRQVYPNDLESLEQVIHKLNCSKHFILHYLVKEKNDNLMEMILKCFKNESEDLLAKFINARRNGGTVLHVAIKSYFVKIASILLDYKININEKDSNDYTALHLAAGKKDLNQISQKLMELGADPGATHNDGTSPLSEASFRNRDLLLIMVQQNPAIIDENSRLQLLRQLVESGNLDDALKLLKYGAITDYSLIETEEIGTIRRYTCWDLFLLLVKFRNPLLSNDLGEPNFDSIKYLFEEMKCNDRILNLILKSIDKEFEDKFFFREKLLFFASVHGWVNVAEKLLEKGTNPNATDSLLRTPMHLAAENNNSDVIELLLGNKLKAEINVLDCYGKSPLYLAAEENNWDLVLYLLNLKDINISPTGNSGILNLAKKNEQIKNKWAEIAEKLEGLKVKPEDNDCYVDVQTKNNWNFISALLLELTRISDVLKKDAGTLFHVACKYNNLEAAKKLIEIGVDINVPDEAGRTGLFLAAEENKWDLALQLLELLKGRRNDFYKNIRTGRTILHLAVENNLEDIVGKLIQTDLDANALDLEGKTASFLAAEKKNWDMVFMLLESEKVNPNVNCTYDGQTLLHLSINNNESDKTLRLIDEKNADVNVIDKGGNTPLMKAAHKSLWNFVIDLLDRGADPTIANNKNETVLHIACRNDEKDIAIKLIGDFRCNVNAEDWFGRTPLFMAAEKGHWELVFELTHREGNAANKENLIYSLAADAGWEMPLSKLLNPNFGNG